nr:hypothetical protein [uncultured Limnohabitans sp.]
MQFTAIASTQDDFAQQSEAVDAVEATSISGFLYATTTTRQLEKVLNNANGAKVPTLSSEMAGIIELRRGLLWGRFRFSEERLRIPQIGIVDTPWAQTNRADITQLSLRLPLSDQTVFTAGRLNINFDDGQSFHVLDFLEDAVRSTDFEDRAGRYRGFPLLMISHSDSGAAYRLLYSDDTIGQSNYTYTYGDPNPGFNRGLKQWIASARWSIDQLTGTLVLQQPLHGNTGIGASFSYVPSASWSFHGSIFGARGNPISMHKNVFLGQGNNLGPNDVYLSNSPVQAWRIDDQKIYLRGLIGATYTSESGVTSVFELWRDERGMTAAEQTTWGDLLRFHNTLSNPTVRSVNLAYDLQSLRAMHGTQAFLRMSVPIADNASFQPSLLVSTRDGSGTANFRWIRKFVDKWELGIETWHRFGGAYTQYGSAPDKSGLQASIRAFF